MINTHLFGRILFNSFYSNVRYLCLGLDSSGYRSSIAHKDENDALLGGEAQMSDEERFKVIICLVSIYTLMYIRILVPQCSTSPILACLHPEATRMQDVNDGH